MMGYEVETMLLAAVVAATCAILGVFLVLRRTAMLSDAISHTVLLGIVLGFFIVKDLNDPLLVVGAAVVGVLTVILTEILAKSGRLNQDAAIGLTFPALFSIAVILISSFTDRSVHLDTDVVLEGNLGLAALDPHKFLGLTPAFWVMVVILLFNVAFISVFYKELKLTTFDAGLAASLGISPVLIHYGLMALVSVTAVGAFDIVGAILVVALMIAPAVTAYLLTDRLNIMIGLSVIIGIIASILGFQFSIALDASIGGTIVAVLGGIFGVALLFSPSQGLVTQLVRRLNQKWEFAQTALVIHLQNHEDADDYEDEGSIEHCQEHIGWTHDFTENVVHKAQKAGLVRRRKEVLYLTDSGRLRAHEAIINY